MISRLTHYCRIHAISGGIRARDRFGYFWLIAMSKELAMHHPPAHFGQRRFSGIKIFIMQLVDGDKELLHLRDRFGHIIILRRKGHLRACQRNPYADGLPHGKTIRRAHQADQQAQQREPVTLIVSDLTVFFVTRNTDRIEGAHRAERSLTGNRRDSHDFLLSTSTSECDRHRG